MFEGLIKIVYTDFPFLLKCQYYYISYHQTNDPNTLNFPHVETYKISFTKNITHIKQLFKQNGVGTGVKLAPNRGGSLSA